jgi:hypothetical protein
MTDTSNNDTASTIEAMIANSAASTTTSGPGNNATPNMVLTPDGNVEITARSNVESSIQVPDGYSAAGQIEALNNEIARIEGELAKGVFDANGNRTGDHFTGRERDLRTTQLTSLRASREFQMARGLQVASQRAANDAARERADAEQAASFAFHGGDPAKAELLRREIDAAEARALAEKIVRGRR